jgi:hypothetical protein
LQSTRSVSRCVAVAAHGKRCQQSPFRGGPYCWHHMQSRKVWPPSRPPGPPPVRLVDSAPVAAAAAEPVGPAADDLDRAARLARALGPERVDALLRFVESGRGGVHRIVEPVRRDEPGRARSAAG